MLNGNLKENQSRIQQNSESQWGEALIPQQNVQNEEDMSFGQYIKKQKLRKRKQKSKNFKKVKAQGFWSIQENKKYLQFLQIHMAIFKSQKSKRTNKIFRKMSQFIKSRSSLQCRSHHQKCIYDSQTIQSLISNLSTKLLQKQIQLQSINQHENQLKIEFRDIKQEDFSQDNEKQQKHSIIELPLIYSRNFKLENKISRTTDNAHPFYSIHQNRQGIKIKIDFNEVEEFI